MTKFEQISSNPGLKISISGVRGMFPSGLTPEIIQTFLLTFGSFVKGTKIVLGRDSRPSGSFLENLAIGTMMAMGKDVISLGIVPTPTVKAIVNATNSSGGIMISASHNPIIWNAFKFIKEKGFFLNNQDLDSLISIINSNSQKQFQFAPKSKLLNSGNEFNQLHVDSVLKRIHPQSIKRKKLKVLIDAVNGAGSYLIPNFLEILGCKVTKLYCEPNGKFPRPPEPTEKALTKASKMMKNSDFDVGFALDPDADRLVVLTQKRGVISEEYTLPLSLFSYFHLNQKRNSNIVINQSTSFLNEWVVNQFSGKTIRSKVGESNVVEEMLKNKSVFGGEGNGGVIDPKVNSFGRDSLTGIAYILQLITEHGSIDSILDQFPKIFIDKTSISTKNQNLEDIYKKFQDLFPHHYLSKIDGCYLFNDNSWVHVRPSNTEPIIRIIVEAKTAKDLTALMGLIQEKI